MFWLAFINSYNPPGCSNIKYADDVTCYNPLKNSNDSCMASVIEWGKCWCLENKMTLNLSKTKALIVTLGSTSKPPIFTTPVESVNSWKFLGITVDNHLNFNEHIDVVTSKARKRFYCLLQLKRMGVGTSKLCLFYLANIRSVLTYAIPAFYSLLTKCQLESLERMQKLCTKIILPDIESYHERLGILKIPELCDFSRQLCKSHFLRIFNKPDHVLHHLIPSRQSETRRHSSRTKDTFLTRCNTAKRNKSFFFYSVKNFI